MYQYIKLFLQMVHGDSEQTLRVLIAYYRQKSESVEYDSNILRDTNVVNKSFHICKEIEMELDDTKTNNYRGKRDIN